MLPKRSTFESSNDDAAFAPGERSGASYQLERWPSRVCSAPSGTSS